jgi:uncharacterized repeat protein (TIGR03943 family)
MRHAIGPILLLTTGGVTLRLAVFGDFVNYVKPSHLPWLLATGTGLMILGATGIAHAFATQTPPTPPARQRPLHTHGPLRADPQTITEDQQRRREQRARDHTRTPPIAWLLCLPLFLALLVPPPPLGAYTAARGSTTIAKPLGADRFSPLPPTDPVALRVYDYAERAVWDRQHTLENRTIALTGFVTPNPNGGWYLTRMRITCCAADARSYLINTTQNSHEYPPNTWLHITGTFTPSTTPQTATITITTATPTRRPADPYEQ